MLARMRIFRVFKCSVSLWFCAISGSPAYNRSIAADVVTKPGHYTNCAKATHELQPRLSIHYGRADADVKALFAAGNLNLARVAPTPGKAAVEDPCCTSALHCARTDSRVMGPRDIFGLLGISCVHGTAGRGSFIDLLSPENFSYYLIMLWCILLSCGTIRDVYIDFGCRLAITWVRFLAHQATITLREGDTVTTGHRRARIMVNWLHAQGHNLPCQLQNSGRHTKDAAWRVGENTEQLWALLKVRYVCYNWGGCQINSSAVFAINQQATFYAGWVVSIRRVM